MIEILLQMAALIVCGVVWRIATPGSLDADTTRRALSGLVYYLMLPALVLLVLWEAPLGINSIKIAICATTGIVIAFAMMRVICKLFNLSAPASGAILLATAFPNATYLGLPVLEAALGPEGRSIAIQYDLFACLPLLLTLGIAIAAHYGTEEQKESALSRFVKVPAVWAAILAIIMNVNDVPLHNSFKNWLQMLGNGVPPLMLISLGLGLHFSRSQLMLIKFISPALLIKLFLAPLVVWGLAISINAEGILLNGIVLEAAMPSMLIGIVFCDRYKLDTNLYAATVTVTTAVSFISLSIWSSFLGI